MIRRDTSCGIVAQSTLYSNGLSFETDIGDEQWAKTIEWIERK